MASASSPALPLTKPEFPFPLIPFSHYRGRKKNKSGVVSYSPPFHFRETILRNITASLTPTIPKLSSFISKGFSVHSFSSDYSPDGPIELKHSAMDSFGAYEPQVSSSTWNWKGYSIRYQHSGNSGPALVLVHGFGANSAHWRKNISVLAKSHRVYAIDLIGYGYSDKPNPREFGDNLFYTFETWATQLNEFCAEVVKDKAFFICNSIGGVIGLQAAVTEPQICKGIILFNISLRLLHIKKQPWFGRPFISSFQSLLRNTALGKIFYRSVATSEAVRSILCQVLYFDKTSITFLSLGQHLLDWKRLSTQQRICIKKLHLCPLGINICNTKS